MTHICKVCGVTSDVAEFYAGVNSRCKECHKTKVRENRAENVAYYRTYDAERYRKDPKRKEALLRYAKTDVGKAVANASNKRWIERNAEKRAAHVILGNAVRDGRKLKPENCQSCGAGGKIHGHHHDYSMPLDVEWLCPTCHTDRHRKA